MKNVGIHEPCSENWNAMTPTEKGAFCQKCAAHVHDFTNKSTNEIKQTLRSLLGQPVCGRITATQEAALNAEFEAWTFRSQRSFQSALVFSLIVVFGLTLFSCSSEQDRKQLKNIQATAMQAVKQAEENPEPAIEKTVTVPREINIGEAEYELIEYQVQEEKQPIDLDGIDVVSIEGHRGYLGGMSYTRVYQDYLISEVPVTADEFDENGNLIPKTFEALAFPNPATIETTIQLAVPVKNNFEIALYDMNGQFIQSVHSGEIERGTFRKQIELTDLPSGIYLITILSANYKETVRISKI